MKKNAKGLEPHIHFLLLEHDLNFPAMGIIRKDFLVRKARIGANEHAQCLHFRKRSNKRCTTADLTESRFSGGAFCCRRDYVHGLLIAALFAAFQSACGGEQLSRSIR